MERGQRDFTRACEVEIVGGNRVGFVLVAREMAGPDEGRRLGERGNGDRGEASRRKLLKCHPISIDSSSANRPLRQ